MEPRKQAEALVNCLDEYIRAYTASYGPEYRHFDKPNARASLITAIEQAFKDLKGE